MGPVFKPVSKKEIEEILQEPRLVECKTALSGERAACESLCGMLNSHLARGLVLFGVAPDRTIVGVEPGELDEAQRSLVEHVDASFDPKVPITLEILDCEGKLIVVLSADRPRTMPLVEYDGRAFIREGSTTRPLSSDERTSFTWRRDRAHHPGPWQCDRCGLVAAVIDPGPEQSYSCDCGGEWWPVTAEGRPC